MQVCNLVWSKNVNELVSTHGYSQNQIIVWRYPTMSKVCRLPINYLSFVSKFYYCWQQDVAHQLTLSFISQTIVTGAGDETLRFWNVFPSPKSQVNKAYYGKSIARCHYTTSTLGLLYLEIIT
ncbi:hypothetical protein BHE74_00026573 [Ensete ventricosum]|uniref:Uncharacterized protein n=1 Tax=Ensete ventricosum TaxID=4639 RepID=A0A444EEJ5_ENSVE|nr:hypothetical protein GW17_00027745 [Ensete ventricosum]RWW66079.1 hypothetical protein BHE74_00026573 [Ensete ventricosum]RZR72419.1 hypothetical protein BHM03_00013277 [Ensete ventricosum]